MPTTVTRKGQFKKKECTAKVRTNATRKYIKCDCCELLLEMEKLLQIGKEFGLEGEKLLEFVEKQQKLEEDKEDQECS